MSEPWYSMTTPGMARDPVCGMVVSEKVAPATAVYKGKTYYFCSHACKKAFEASPETYLVRYSGIH